MTRRAPSTRALAFTLIETIAVVVLMAIVTAALLPAFARRSDQTNEADLVARLITLDQQARIAAPRHDACFLEVDPQKQLIRLVAVDNDRSIELTRAAFPAQTEARLAESAERVGFSGVGRSSNYEYRIVRNARELARLRFNGLTGWYELERTAGDP